MNQYIKCYIDSFKTLHYSHKIITFYDIQL